MASSQYIPGTVYTLGVGRYDKPFEVMRGVLDQGFLTDPSGGTWLEGTVVDVSGGYMVVAASGKGMGFALQTVLSSASTLPLGYLNPNKTNIVRGDMCGMQFGLGMCATKIHEGSGDIGDYAWWNGSTIKFDAYGSVPSGVKVLGRLIQADGPDTTVGVNGTAGSKTTASSVKAILLFDIPIDDVNSKES